MEHLFANEHLGKDSTNSGIVEIEGAYCVCYLLFNPLCLFKGLVCITFVHFLGHDFDFNDKASGHIFIHFHSQFISEFLIFLRIRFQSYFNGLLQQLLTLFCILFLIDVS